MKIVPPGTPTHVVPITFAVLVVQRLFELGLARRNAARALARGGREFGARHYPLFFVLHTGWLLGWLAEAMLQGHELTEHWQPWVLVIALAQGLRLWAISSLGERWNTRVLVVPGDTPLRVGPYRWISHPNYVAVVIEIAAFPLLFDAWITATVASVLNLLLLLCVRIPCERAALRWAADQAPPRASA